jgi:predicted AlkP superfamily pyrophosphatase or phosphodiesterase
VPPLGLADVSRSAAAAIGLAGFHDTLGIGECRQVVVLLVDGLGWNLLQSQPHLAPRLLSLPAAPISASFPTTTPVGLGSFGTGLPPGAHGLVGASFWLPESEQILSPLHWGDDPLPVAVQPEPTVFEHVARSGITMSTVSPGAYAQSGLTRAVLRGPTYLPSEDLDSRVSEVADILRREERSYTYVYWFELDRIGHEFGVDSDQWRAALGRVDSLVDRLVEILPGDAVLVVTADHGMVDCPVELRIQVDDDPRLMAGVTALAGEPRARHVYVRDGAAGDVQVVESGLMGEVDPSLSARLGHVMAVSSGSTMLASRFDSTVSRLIGQHGALTDDEVLIPAVIQRGP